MPSKQALSNSKFAMQALAHEVACYLGLDLGGIKIKRFADGEIYVQVQVLSLSMFCSSLADCIAMLGFLHSLACLAHGLTQILTSLKLHTYC